MSIVKAITATGHVDKQNVVFTTEALESIVQQAKQNYIKVGAPEHDPRKMPIGRIVDSNLIALPDGTPAVETTMEIFDGENPLPDQPEKELKVVLCDDRENLSIRYDYSYRDAIAELEKFNNKFNHHGELQYYGKKAAEPISVLILVGSFILGKIFEGFLQKAGEEAFNLLKGELQRALQLPKEHGERILEFDLTVSNGDQKHSVRLFLTNPTESEIDLVLTKGLKKLDNVLGDYLHPSIRELGINVIERKFEVTYALNGKAKPIVPVEEKRLIDIEV